MIINNIPSLSSAHYLETPSHPSFPAWDTLGHLFFNRESSRGSPAAGPFCSPLGVQHPQAGQGCNAPRRPAKCRSQASLCWKIQRKRAWEREKFARHHLILRWSHGVTGTCTWAWEAALIPPALCWDSSNSPPPSSTSPLDFLRSFANCSMKMFSTENINLQVTLELLTAFIQCSYFVV